MELINRALYALGFREPQRPRAEARDLNEQDILGWNTALDDRETSPMKPRTREEVRTLIRAINPIKWRQIQKDIRWVEKQMRKHGLNPDDWRYVL